MPRTALSIENGKVKRKPYKELRSREYLKPDEIENLMDAARETGRYGHRDTKRLSSSPTVMPSGCLNSSPSAGIW